MPWVIAKRDHLDVRRVLVAENTPKVAELWGLWPDGVPAPREAKRFVRASTARRKADECGEQSYPVAVVR